MAEYLQLFNISNFEPELDGILHGAGLAGGRRVRDASKGAVAGPGEAGRGSPRGTPGHGHRRHDLLERGVVGLLRLTNISK